MGTEILVPIEGCTPLSRAFGLIVTPRMEIVRTKKAVPAKAKAAFFIT
jgi:hypothetical protein